ncbi:phosphatase PAP2 family protein [Bacteroidia bacterium]|nr:phosphatase PAP2 family protein [Bacteroidia bacterium]
MIEFLQDIDQSIFILIHEKWAHPILDAILLPIRNALTWIPLYVLFIFLIFKEYQLKGFYFLLAAILSIILTDQFSAGFMKPFFERLRPCHEPSLSQHIRHIIDCGGQYGFISSHATNHFGLAVIFTWFFTKKHPSNHLHWIFYVWAGLISFAQVYVGKHYLGDIMVGAIAGFIIGKFIVTGLHKVLLKS